MADFGEWVVTESDTIAQAILHRSFLATLPRILPGDCRQELLTLYKPVGTQDNLAYLVPRLSERHEKMRSNFSRLSGIIAGIVAGLAGGLYLLLASTGLAPTPWTCISESQGSVSNVDGFDLKIDRVSCSTIGSDSSISVSIFEHDSNEGAVILKYDPDDRNPLPVIRRVASHEIEISIPSVSSVFEERPEWHGMKIKYILGSETYNASHNSEYQ